MAWHVAVECAFAALKSDEKVQQLSTDSVRRLSAPGNWFVGVFVVR
jgi:hypothetical protein